jgi:hypothetical protein
MDTGVLALNLTEPVALQPLNLTAVNLHVGPLDR